MLSFQLYSNYCKPEICDNFLYYVKFLSVMYCPLIGIELSYIHTCKANEQVRILTKQEFYSIVVLELLFLAQ